MIKIKTILLILLLASLYFKSSTIFAQEHKVVLNWSVNNYVPYWYQGLRLPTIGSQIKVGLTHLNRNQDDYYYQWFVNDKRLNDWEKNKKETSFIIEKSNNLIELRIGKKEIIKSKLSLPDKEIIRLVGSEFLKIEVFDPEILIYLNDNERLRYFDDLIIKPGTKKEFLAVPYFFNINDLEELKFTWRFLGQVFNNEDFETNKFILDLKEGSAKSVSILSVMVLDKLSAQNISAEVKIRIK